jgi:hypothetical protein
VEKLEFGLLGEACFGGVATVPGLVDALLHGTQVGEPASQQRQSGVGRAEHVGAPAVRLGAR